jgi:hypothetical protein
MSDFELFLELLTQLDPDELSLGIGESDAPRDTAEWDEPNRALARTLDVIFDTWGDVWREDVCVQEVKVSRRSQRTDGPEEYFNYYGTHQIRELQEEQPIGWFVKLPEIPIPQEEEEWSKALSGMAPHERTAFLEAGPPAWFRFVAYSARRGPTLLVCRVRQEGDRWTEPFQLRSVSLLRRGAGAWQDLVDLLRWQAEV